jgi:hypothetical protein
MRVQRIALDAIASNTVENPVISFLIDPPQSGLAQARQPRTELETQQPKQPEDKIRISGCVRDQLDGWQFCLMLH